MKKDLLILALILILIYLGVSGIHIQSVEDYYLTHSEDITEASKTVTLTIRCDTIKKHYDQLDESLKNTKYIPKDGVILPETTYVLRKNDTVFDILIRATKNNRIPLDYEGTSSYNTAYIKGINHIYEFSCGPLSGWTYSVNNQTPGYGCSKYKLKNHDNISFTYSCDLGRDLQE